MYYLEMVRVDDMSCEASKRKIEVYPVHQGYVRRGWYVPWR